MIYATDDQKKLVDNCIENFAKNLKGWIWGWFGNSTYSDIFTESLHNREYFANLDKNRQNLIEGFNEWKEGLQDKNCLEIFCVLNISFASMILLSQLEIIDAIDKNEKKYK